MGEPLSSPFKGGGLLERRSLLKSGGVIWDLRYFHIIFIPLRFFPSVNLKVGIFKMGESLKVGIFKTGNL